MFKWILGDKIFTKYLLLFTGRPIHEAERRLLIRVSGNENGRFSTRKREQQAQVRSSWPSVLRFLPRGPPPQHPPQATRPLLRVGRLRLQGLAPRHQSNPLPPSPRFRPLPQSIPTCTNVICSVRLVPTIPHSKLIQLLPFLVLCPPVSVTVGRVLCGRFWTRFYRTQSGLTSPLSMLEIIVTCQGCLCLCEFSHGLILFLWSWKISV